MLEDEQVVRMILSRTKVDYKYCSFSFHIFLKKDHFTPNKINLIKATLTSTKKCIEKCVESMK